MTPEVDRRQVEREVDHVRSEFQDAAEGISVSADPGGIAGAGAGGGAVPTSDGSAFGTAVNAAAGSRVGNTIAGAGGGSLIGGAAKAAVPVAAAGTVFFGMSQALDRLAAASPALQAQSAQFSSAMSLFFKPFGDFIASRLDPFVDNMIDMAVSFNSAVDGAGLPIASAGLAADISDAVGLSGGAAASELFGVNGLVWNDFVGNLDWSTFVTELAWQTFITGLDDWTRYVDAVALGNFVRAVDLGAFVTGINLGNFIDVPDFLSDGNPGGQTPGRDPDPPDPGSPPTGGVGGGDGSFGESDPPPSNDDGSSDGGGGGSDPPTGGVGGGDGSFGVSDPDPDPPSGRFPDTFSSLDTGGQVRSGGMARLHSGERVLPEAQVSDRGEADLARGDEITRQLRQIHREIRRQNDGGGRDDAIVDRLDRLLRTVESSGSSPMNERDVYDALVQLFDRRGGRDPRR